mmetsp:Transcript_10670/g.23597  ORF Transcript_10670/g.23597 Transcript_10670/m.23597 type:complete len:768 (+) Transcript_10670:82-2385(+)
MSNNEIPAVITTAHLLLRGLVPAFVGCSIGDGDDGSGKKNVQASAFQMTYRKDLPKLGNDGGYTGKLSWNLGKKWGTELSSTSFPKEEDLNESNKKEHEQQIEEFWTTLEKAANRLISDSKNVDAIRKYNYDNEEAALKELGMGILDGGQCGAREKRKKKADKAKKEGKDVPSVESEPSVSVGHLVTTADGSDETTTLVLALLHGTNLVPLSHLGKIKILRDNPKNESNVVCNKKRCEVTIKFCVLPEDNAMDVTLDNSESSLKSMIGEKCMSKDVRVAEGLDYQLYMQQVAMEALSTANAAKETEAATASTTTANDDTKPSDEMVVTAFEVSGSIDYTKLIEKFGSKPLTPYMIRRLENVTVKRGTVPNVHRFLRRNIFFSHRDIEKICELLENWYGVSPPSEDESMEEEAPVNTERPTTPCPIYLYTGRGPSSAAMHLGHLVPFLFTAWLQKAFQCPLVVQMTDDEKFLFKGEYNSEDAGDGSSNTEDPDRTGDNLDRFAKLTIENAKDIIACDFIPEKTFLFSDLNYVGTMYPNIVRIWKAVTVNQVNGVFGFDGTSNIGKAAFPAIQAAPSFGSSFPTVLGGGETNAATLACLIPCAIDQDPYFRLTRDVAHKLVPRHHPLKGKPALIHSKFFPPLQGAQGKMSSSDGNSAVFLTDTPKEIARKIKVHAFSGGQDTKKLQEELGANLDVDVSYQWLRFFMEDDEELAQIGREYGSGSGEHWSTGMVKAKLVEVLTKLVEEHQERRMVVTEEVVKKWMSERCIA